MTASTTVRPRRSYRPPAPLGGRVGGGRNPQRNARLRLLRALPFLAPALIVLTVFVAWPMVSAFLLSFTDSSGFGEPEWIGFENYASILTDPNIRDAVVNTALYAALFTPTSVLIALGFALIVNSPRLPFRGLFRTALFLPFIISLAVAAFAWTYLIDPQVGLLTYWLAE